MVVSRNLSLGPRLESVASSAGPHIALVAEWYIRVVSRVTNAHLKTNILGCRRKTCRKFEGQMHRDADDTHASNAKMVIQFPATHGLLLRLRHALHLHILLCHWVELVIQVSSSSNFFRCKIE